MTTKKAVTVKLDRHPKENKKVVRYVTDAEGAAMSSTYITKEAVAELGNPDGVKITIEAA